VTREMVAALAAIYILALSSGLAAADESGSAEKIPEPALRWAKDASERVTETERDWLKLAQGLAKNQADFRVTEGSANSLREQASRLLCAAKKLLEEQKRIGSDLERFKDTLRKAAGHYADVAALCKRQAAQVRAEEVKDDYLALARVYEAKARAAEARMKTLSISAGVKDKAEVITEGNLFLDRFVDALPIGPERDSDFAGRLMKHGERCKVLADELSQAIEKFLEEAEAMEVREKLGGNRKEEHISGKGQEKSGTIAKKAQPKKDLSFLIGQSWTSPVTIRGVECEQVIRFDADGNCFQTAYRSGPKGRGSRIGSVRVRYEVDSEGFVSVYQGALMIERGEVTALGKDEWTYEILASLPSPQLAGTKIRFARETRP
jgi:hypothetical protein